MMFCTIAILRTTSTCCSTALPCSTSSTLHYSTTSSTTVVLYSVTTSSTVPLMWRTSTLGTNLHGPTSSNCGRCPVLVQTKACFCFSSNLLALHVIPSFYVYTDKAQKQVRSSLIVDSL
jgi:hypothetical protein